MVNVLELDVYSLHMDFLVNRFWIRAVIMKRHSFVDGEHFDLVKMPVTLRKELIVKNASLRYHDKWQNHGTMWQMVDIVGTDLEIKEKGI